MFFKHILIVHIDSIKLNIKSLRQDRNIESIYELITTCRPEAELLLFPASKTKIRGRMALFYEWQNG